MTAIAAEEPLAPRIGFGRIDEDVLRGLQAGEKQHAGERKGRNRDQHGARARPAGQMCGQPRLETAPASFELKSFRLEPSTHHAGQSRPKDGVASLAYARHPHPAWCNKDVDGRVKSTAMTMDPTSGSCKSHGKPIRSCAFDCDSPKRA